MDKYFETLINQTLKNFEVIIVDDCSTDGSRTAMRAGWSGGPELADGSAWRGIGRLRRTSPALSCRWVP